MKQITILFLWIVIYGTGYAQNIKQGDRFTFNRKLDFEYGIDKTMAIEELRGHHVIIDLFASGCIACFKGMPKLQAMHERYKGKVDFLVIGKTDSHIRGIYEKLSRKNALTLAVAFDSVIFREVGVPFVPFTIWINPDGTVYNVSGASELKPETIDRFIEGKPYIEPPSVAEIKYDPGRPLLMYGNGGPDSVYLKRSVLTRYERGQPTYGASVIPPDAHIFQAMAISFSGAFMMAAVGEYAWWAHHPFYGKIYPEPLISPEDSAWVPSYHFNYSVEVPDGAFLRGVMLSDFENTLGWRARVEQRLMPCFNLVLLAPDTMHLSSSDNLLSGDADLGGINVRGYPIWQIIQLLDRMDEQVPPVINCTGIKGKVNLTIDALMNDMEQVRQSLRKSGLDIVKGHRWMTVVVLEKTGKKLVTWQ